MKRARLFSLVLFLLGVAGNVLLTPGARAASYSTTPDTLYFTPTGSETTLTGYVRIQYAGDTTMPGVHIHASITSGSSYFSTSHDTVYTRSSRYWAITYTVQSSVVTGTITFSDDTTTKTVVLIGRAAPDQELIGIGPYFLTTPKNATGCEYLRLINRGSDADTVLSLHWSHGPGPYFGYDTTLTLPHVIPPHDTLLWTFCFAAPDTLVHLDTITVGYADAYSHSRTVSRIIYAKAIDTTRPDGELTGVGPYWSGTIAEGSTNCQNLRLVNTGSDVDTVVSIAWTHDPAGLFRYDTSFTLPHVLAAHDTAFWSICFHAPSDTLWHTDTLIVHYHDAQSQDRYIRRVVMARASDTTLHECNSLYAHTLPVTEVGDTTRFLLYVINHLDSAVQLTALHISGSGDAAFLVDSSVFPLTVGAQTHDSLWLAFAPHSTSTSTYSATVTGTFTSNDTTHCRTATLSLVGYSAQSARDTESVSLSDTTARHVALVNDSTSLYYSHRVDILNNIGVRIRIDTVYMTGSSHMYIAQNIRSMFPDTLANGAKHSVIVHFYGDSAHTIYHDTLTVIMENALLPFYIYLDGYSSGAKQAVAFAATTHSSLSVYPNPSARFMTIAPAGMLHVSYELTDVLGNSVAQHLGDEPWRFDAAGLPQGHYFLRATGVDVLGNAVVVTRSIEVAAH